MQPRQLEKNLLKTASYYPIVLVDGPRQSGKTTLCRGIFPNKPYISLESIDNRVFAKEDPRGFLTEYKNGAIIDEVQNVPELMSYLQEEVDREPQAGRFILSGSQNLSISQLVSQSLAGRIGILHLLPLSRYETLSFKPNADNLYELLWKGGYPRIYDQKIPAQKWLADYVATYLQKDVRQLLNITDMNRFDTFLRLCAANTAQEINLSKLGADAGISYNTANSWLSILETSFICFRLPAWHRNTKKQIVKAPKLHFFDSGLACYLLGIKEPEQLRFHPLRGAIFESWVATEYYKKQTNQGETVNLFHYRESRGLEVDLINDNGVELELIESKSGETLSKDHYKNLNKLEEKLLAKQKELKVVKHLIFGGEKNSSRYETQTISWNNL